MSSEGAVSSSIGSERSLKGVDLQRGIEAFSKNLIIVIVLMVLVYGQGSFEPMQCKSPQTL